MNFLEILILDIIIASFLLPIVLRISAIYKKERLVQIGPTCGFYAFIYAINQIKDTDPKKEVRKIIKESISGGDSCVGEIFDLNIFVKIGKRYYPDIEISIKTFESTKDLDILLKDYYLVYPILSWKTPHYYLVDMGKERKYFYYSTDFSKHKSKHKEKMFNENKKLVNSKVYKWSQYFKSKRILSFFRWLQWTVWDKELYEFIRDNDKEKKAKWRRENSSIDMVGQVVAIKKV